MNGLDLFRFDAGEDFTADHVSQGGRPAACLPCDGIPAYESENAKLLVMENVAYFQSGANKVPMLFPLSYQMVALRAPSGLTALHDAVDAVWTWRPLLYFLRLDGTRRTGSQQELEWRIGLYQARLAGAERDDAYTALLLEALAWMRTAKRTREETAAEFLPRLEALRDTPYPELGYATANRRARALLLEHLTPQQRIDYHAWKCFYVRGELNPLYRVEPGNGYQIVDPISRETTVSICLHPDDWIPDDDVALATKLAIDAGIDSEAGLLEAGKTTLRQKTHRTTDEERYAADVEAHL